MQEIISTQFKFSSQAQALEGPLLMLSYTKAFMPFILQGE